MKHGRLVNTIITSALIAITAGQAFAQNAVKLEYKLQTGQILRYKVYDKSYGMSLGSNPEDAAVVTDGILKLQVLKILPNGDTELRAEYEKGTVRAIGQTKSLSAQSVATAIFKVSKNGVIRDVDNVFKDAGFVSVTETSQYGHSTVTLNVYASMLACIFREYPSKELKIGETWKSSAADYCISGLPKAESKLLSIEKKPGVSPVALIATTGEQSDKMTSSDGSDASSVTIKAIQNTKASFSIDNGYTVSCDNKTSFTSICPEMTSTSTLSTQVLLLPDGKVK